MANLTIETIQMNGRDFLVKMPCFEDEIAELEKTLKEYQAEEQAFYPIWERDESLPENVVTDIESLIDKLRQIEANPSLLASEIEQVRKKKNGGFWRNSGHDVLIAEHCTEYFTDFTNAWSALMIRLDVEDEMTCRLSVRHRTFTQ